MGEVVSFRRAMHPSAIVRETSIQVSRYPQDDGTGLFSVEILFPDGKWDSLHYTSDLADAWKVAGKEADERNVTLLPDSLWPGRSHKAAI